MTLGMMLIAGSMPLILLLNPTWVEALPPPDGRPLVTILVDTSGSMDVSDSAAQTETRLSRATDLAARLVDAFDGTFETRMFAFDATLRGASIEELGSVIPGRQTDVAAAIDAAADSDRPRGQAIVMFSDGIHNAGSSRRVLAAARSARSRGAPIFPVKIANPLSIKNLSVETDADSRLAFVDQPVQLSAAIASNGFDTAAIEVQLIRDGEVIETQTVIVESSQVSKVTFTASPEQPGLYRYTIAAGLLPGEVTEEDNSAGLLVRVVDSPIGVLLLEGKPYWDSKFLARNLAADPSVNLESLVRMRNDRFLHRRQTLVADRPGSRTADVDSAEDESTAPLADTRFTEPSDRIVRIFAKVPGDCLGTRLGSLFG